ncbi:ankyrin repeat domain-containing protein [Wolbachia endosymbiont of Cylisticus convexus]|uniref:ankyrin repeat domain-containing protein n=1 Tax=Wolbachia endosymbiont of Cylisticus convexus TaxID=118728 RepID=UPI000DF6A3CE|nr:ankyrin repeat domain-containing protein [Wolbachia endosymbiont of Cylisticus convexus]RDD35207.1 ankyrin repeat domain-containing protein [Wolbachia endosymbiont of Cylisticus convexus]
MIGSTDEIKKLLLANEANVSWRYIGPFDKTRQIVQADNLLHLAARIQDKDKFVDICRKNIASVTAHNEYGNNPFHEAARSGVLLPAVKDIVRCLETEADNKIIKAQEAGDRKEVSRLKEELKCNKKYIKDALCSKDHAFNKKRETPLYYLDATQQKEIKQIADIKCGFICSKKFHICLYIVGVIVCTIAMCVSLYLLFSVSQSLALASIATIASGGSSYLLFKTCNEVYGLYNESTIVDPDAMQLLEGGLTP